MVGYKPQISGLQVFGRGQQGRVKISLYSDWVGEGCPSLSLGLQIESWEQIGSSPFSNLSQQDRAEGSRNS